MNDEMTVLQAAQAAGISKNTAKYRLTKAPAGSTRKGPDGRIIVSAAGLNWLKETAGKPAQPVDKPEQPDDNRTINQGQPGQPVQTDSNQAAVVDVLREEIAILKRQVEQQEKQLEQNNKTINGLTVALEHAQQLHAATAKQLTDATAASTAPEQPPAAPDPTHEQAPEQQTKEPPAQDPNQEKPEAPKRKTLRDFFRFCKK